MSGPQRLAAAVQAADEAAQSTAPVQRGPIADVRLSKDSFVVTVDLGYKLTVLPDGLSGFFLSELNAAKNSTAGIESLIGRKVEVTFSAGRQAAIAYTVGV